MNVNQLVDYYAQTPLFFQDIFMDGALPGNQATGGRTGEGCCGLIIPLAGSACFALNGTAYVLEPGMIVHAGSDMQLDKAVLGSKTWRYAVIHYQIFEQHSAGFSCYDRHFNIPTGPSPRITTMVQQLLACAARPDSLALLRSKTLFTNLIEETVLAAKRQHKDNHGELIADAVAFMHENYAEQISIEQLAAQYGFNGKRFAEIFQKHIAMAPVVYLGKFRIDRAKDLLRSCGCTVAEIAECVGYKDAAYFSRLFKKQVGISPTAFREQSGKSLC